MINEIKLYEKLSILELKDGEVLQTTMSIDKIAELLNRSDFIVIDGVGFNKFEVKKFYEYKPTDVDCFVLAQPKEIREKLQKEIKRRKSENQRISMEIMLNVVSKFQE